MFNLTPIVNKFKFVKNFLLRDAFFLKKIRKVNSQNFFVIKILIFKKEKFLNSLEVTIKSAIRKFEYL